MRLRVDHFSIAVRSIDRALGFFARYFPVRMHRATAPGYTDDFRWCDFHVGHVKIELIESTGPGTFVDRFLERRGEGIHHLSVDVDELDPLVARMEADGLRIVDRFDLGDGERTAFVSPRSAHGMLIQLWQEKGGGEPEAPPPIAPMPGTGSRMRFDHLAVAVRSIPEAFALFARYFPISREAIMHRGYAGDFDIKHFEVNGFRIELIADASGSSFVVPFLARRGEGFHHLSIDVDDLDPIVARMKADGLRIVDEADLGHGYRTAFVSPRSAHGILIQFWQVPDLSAGWE